MSHSVDCCARLLARAPCRSVLRHVDRVRTRRFQGACKRAALVACKRAALRRVRTRLFLPLEHQHQHEHTLSTSCLTFALRQSCGYLHRRMVSSTSLSWTLLLQQTRIYNQTFSGWRDFFCFRCSLNSVSHENRTRWVFSMIIYYYGLFTKCS